MGKVGSRIITALALFGFSLFTFLMDTSTGPMKMKWCRFGLGFLVPRPAVPEYAEKIRIAMESGTSQKMEFTWVNARGVELYLGYVIVPEFDQEGKVISVLSVGHDLTERKRAEKELCRLNEEMRCLNAELEDRVKERTAELEKKNRDLERMNKLLVGREIRMVELKKRIRELEGGR